MRPLFSLGFALALVGCGLDAPELPAPAPAPSPSRAEPSSPSERLDRMDGRARLPLLPMMANQQKRDMRDHLAAVQAIVTALATDDFAGVERAAARIGYSEEVGRKCTQTGAAARSFTEQSLAFHHTADRIGAAARERDRARVLSELGVTLEACDSCHATWKQQVVDESAWRRLTSPLLPPDPDARGQGSGHGH